MTAVLERPADRGGPVDQRRRLVVVGNGMAGARAVEEILERDGAQQFSIVMFGNEPYGNYNRIMLSHVLSGEEQDSDIFLNSLAWYESNGITLHAGWHVDRIDRHSRTVTAADSAGQQRVEPYDVLILATGSHSFMPAIEGLRTADGGLLPGVFAFRTIDDTRNMVAHAQLEHHRRAVVIGGGLLGLEAARGLQTHGLDVTVVHAGPHLMNAQVGPAAGEVLRSSVEQLGIEVLTSARTTHLVGEDRVRGVGLREHPVLECDMVVVAAGVRPNVQLAVTSGLAVERAVVVDDHLRVLDEDAIYAVGECVQHRGEVYGLVAPLWEMATVLADQITGADPGAAYHGSRTATKLKVAGVDVASMGLTGPERDTDEHLVFSEPRQGVYKSVVIRDDRLIGATLLGDVSKVAFLTQAFDKGLALPQIRAELMFDLGGDKGAEQGVAELDDDSQVCNCNGVSKGALVHAVESGCTTTRAVMDKTRAGKGCGSCKSLVQKIVEWAAGDASTVDESANWYVPGIPMAKPALMQAIREQQLQSVSAVFAALAPAGAEDAKSKMGLASLLKTMWNERYVDERDARFINDRVHANIQRDGTFSVVPQIRGGVTSPDQLRRIADVAERYDVKLLKITGGQRIDLLGVRKEDLPKVWADLDMPSGYAYGKSFRTVKTCVGQDFCRFGVGDSTALGIDLETRYQGLESPAKLKLAVSGCPRNCAESYVKDVGVVAIEGGRWEIYIGGAAGAHIRKGDLLATVSSRQEVMTLVGRFMQYYRENATWLERTYAFVPRVGLDKIRAVVVDDSEGIAADLDAAIGESVAVYRDPWKEGREPAEVGQFRTALPLEVLPRVPIR